MEGCGGRSRPGLCGTEGGPLAGDGVSKRRTLQLSVFPPNIIRKADGGKCVSLRPLIPASGQGNTRASRISRTTMKTYLTQFFGQLRPNIALAAPVMFGQAANVFVGLVDNYMVAQIGGTEGQTALAAAAAANAVFILVLLLGTGISCGMTPLISYRHAGNDRPGIRKVLESGLAVNLTVGIVLAVSTYFAAPLLQHPALGQTEAVGRLACPYLRIVGFSLIPVMVFQSYKQLSDGMSDTRTGMIALVIANLINVAANYAFIYGHWGAPALGLEGAAWGTFISRVCLVFIIVAVLYARPAYRSFVRIGNPFGMASRSTMRKVLAIGFPTGLQMLFEVGLFSACAILAGRFGETALAAHQIVGQMTGFTYTFVSGLAVAATIRVSYYLGRGQTDRLRLAASSLILTVLSIMAVFGVGYIVFREAIPRFFIDTQQLVSMAAPLFVVAAGFQLFDGLQVVCQGALRGLYDVKVPTVINAVGYWVIAFPLAVYLSVFRQMQTLGIWIGIAIGLVFCALLLTLRLYNRLRKMQTAGCPLSERPGC